MVILPLVKFEREGAGTLVCYRALEIVVSFFDSGCKLKDTISSPWVQNPIDKPDHRLKCWLYHLIPMGLSTGHSLKLKWEPILSLGALCIQE